MAPTSGVRRDLVNVVKGGGYLVKFILHALGVE